MFPEKPAKSVTAAQLAPLVIELLRAVKQLDSRLQWLERADPLAAYRQRRQPFERLEAMLEFLAGVSEQFEELMEQLR